MPITYQPTDLRDTSPQLIALGNFGGTTPTHALQFGSPAIDAADPLQGDDFDQRGFERTAGEWDIGAFEIQDNRIRYVTLATDEDNICDQDCSLREAVAAAPQGGMVTFAEALSGTPIVVNLGDIIISNDVTIAGQGADQIVISGGFGNHRIFFVNTINVTISGITLTEGGEGSMQMASRM